MNGTTYEDREVRSALLRSIAMTGIVVALTAIAFLSVYFSSAH